jgi:two-component system NarL family sensor kinase
VREAAAERAVALVRVAALPVILMGERLVEHPRTGGAVFDWLLVLGSLYALWALIPGEGHLRGRVPRSVYPVIDLALIVGLTYTSGGAFSQVRFAFFLLPVGAAFLMSPRGTATWSVISVVTYLAVSLNHPATDRGADVRFILSQTLYLAWIGIAAVLLATVLTSRARRVEELAAARGRLLADTVSAEERERKRLAEALHDEAVQDLLAAGQDLDDAGRGDGEALDRAREEVRGAVAQLRGVVSTLHPYVLEHAGLEAALHSLVERRRRGGTLWTLDVDGDARGTQDRLLVSVARELIANAATHSEADAVSVSVRRENGALLLEVADDGRGIDPEHARAAVAQGHLGLAACAERLEAAGGRLELQNRPGGGTLARAWLGV